MGKKRKTIWRFTYSRNTVDCLRKWLPDRPDDVATVAFANGQSSHVTQILLDDPQPRYGLSRR